MFFLDFVWWNPLTWISEGLEKLQGAIMGAVRALTLSVNSIVYKLLIDLYTLFEALCSARILDEEVLENLATRIGYILGVVMLFFVIVSFIRMLLDPDTINDKNKGAFNVIKKVLLVIVMLGVSNYTFTLLFSIQKTVVKSHVISKLLLPYDVDTQHFGGALSAELFTTFYNVSLDYLDEDGNVLGTDENVQLCQQEVYTLKERITENGDFSLADVCLMAYTTYTGADGEERQGYIIDYNWLICFGVGVYTVYLLGSYCISVGIRMIQLAFLEIISPMAIVSYLSPKQDTMFSKWTKIYTSTYLDVFIRIAIINFMIYLIALVFGSGTDQTFWNSFTIAGSNPIGTRRLLTVVMILALLAFAKKAPKLLQELFPAGSSKLGDFGGMHGKNVFGAAAGAATGAAVGMVTAGFGREGWRNKLTGMAGGAVTGLFRGGMSGVGGKGAISKAAKTQWGKMKEANMAYNNGARFSRRILTKADNALSAGQTLVPRLERQKAQLQREGNARYKQNIDALNRANKSYNAVSSAKSNIKDLALKRLHSGKLDGLDGNASGARSVLNLESKIAATQEKLKSVDPSNTGAVNALNDELLSYQASLDSATKHFVSEYYSGATNAELDSYKAALGAEFSSNSDLYSGQSLDDWDGVDAAGNYANSQVSANASVLTDYQAQYDQLNDQIAELDRQIEAAKNDSGPIFGPPGGGPWGGPPPGGPWGGPPPGGPWGGPPPGGRP